MTTSHFAGRLTGLARHPQRAEYATAGGDGTVGGCLFGFWARVVGWLVAALVVWREGGTGCSFVCLRQVLSTKTPALHANALSHRTNCNVRRLCGDGKPDLSFTSAENFGSAHCKGSSLGCHDPVPPPHDAARLSRVVRGLLSGRRDDHRRVRLPPARIYGPPQVRVFSLSPRVRSYI